VDIQPAYDSPTTAAQNLPHKELEDHTGHAAKDLASDGEHHILADFVHVDFHDIVHSVDIPRHSSVRIEQVGELPRYSVGIHAAFPHDQW
jgi:hypothetical protein